MGNGAVGSYRLKEHCNAESNNITTNPTLLLYTTCDVKAKLRMDTSHKSSK